MSAKLNRYLLNDFNNLLFTGFNYELPAETIRIISELALEVGSPDYVKTPIFQKRENPMRAEISADDATASGGGGGFKKKRGNKSMEISDGDWETIRSFQTTKIEERAGIEGEIDNIRSYLNKITDKNYNDNRDKITDIIGNIITGSQENIISVSSAIFDIASTNRFYSKLYADLYTDIIKKYPVMRDSFEESLSSFSELFKTIEYVDSNVDYGGFCKMNKDNEKRKALGMFFVNLSLNGIISTLTILNITRNLLFQIFTYITEDNKKNEVDELTENVALFYKKEFYENEDKPEYELIKNHSITEVIEIIAHSKVKDYKSLTNKTIFKFMDMIDM
jgi:hypothetical protein